MGWLFGNFLLVLRFESIKIPGGSVLNDSFCYLLGIEIIGFTCRLNMSYWSVMSFSVGVWPLFLPVAVDIVFIFFGI